MSQEKFKFLVNYTRKVNRKFYSFTVPAGYELIDATDIGDAFYQAVHHTEKHGWMQLNGWQVQNIIQVDNDTKPSDIKERETISCGKSGEEKTK